MHRILLIVLLLAACGPRVAGESEAPYACAAQDGQLAAIAEAVRGWDDAAGSSFETVRKIKHVLEP